MREQQKFAFSIPAGRQTNGAHCDGRIHWAGAGANDVRVRLLRASVRNKTFWALSLFINQFEVEEKPRNSHVSDQ